MEFTLVIPILIILVVGIADFGRVFAAGVVLETAARDAAEAAAQEYLSNPPGPLSAPAPPANDPYYAALHERSARVACAETRELPNSDYQADGTCPTWPVVRVCVHDGQDGLCGDPAGPGFAATVPPECSSMAVPPTSSQNGSPERWVEVRLCYRFTALLNLPLFSLGDFYLERQRQFVIPCYFVLGTDPCGS